MQKELEMDNMTYDLDLDGFLGTVSPSKLLEISQDKNQEPL